MAIAQAALSAVRTFQDRHDATFNTWLNHLLVIFAFLIPLSPSGRKSVFFALIVVFLLRGRYVHYLRAALQDRLVQAFALYFLVHVVWLLGTDDWENANRVMGQAEFLLYPLLFASFIDPRFIPRVFLAFFAAMIVSELWSFGIFFEVLPVHTHNGNQGTPANPTPVWHHIHYGFILAVSLVLVMQRLLTTRDNRPLQLLFGFFFITASINIFITAGRTGYVLYLILLVTLFLLVWRKHLFKALATALILCTVAFSLAYNFSDTFHQRTLTTAHSIEKLFTQQEFGTSLGIRAAALVVAADGLKDHWLLGVGTGDDMLELRERAATDYPDWSQFIDRLVHIHNEYARAWLQFGVVGLLAFLYLLYWMYRYPASNPEYKNVQIILATAVLFFSIIDIFVQGLAALLVVITLISLTLNRYPVSNARYAAWTLGSGVKYAALAASMELVSWVA
jgi:O-antigen ligase